MSSEYARSTAEWLDHYKGNVIGIARGNLQRDIPKDNTEYKSEFLDKLPLALQLTEYQKVTHLVIQDILKKAQEADWNNLGELNALISYIRELID